MSQSIIYNDPDTGNLCIEVLAEGADIERAVETLVPAGVPYEILFPRDIPQDRTFRDSWEHDLTTGPNKIAANVDKAKLVAHEVRRQKRDEAFKPLDVQATIPFLANKAEAERAIIRTEDATKQSSIDAASTIEELKVIING